MQGGARAGKDGDGGMESASDAELEAETGNTAGWATLFIVQTVHFERQTVQGDGF